MSAQLQSFEHALLTDAARVERILREFPLALIEPECVIRCSPENAERAICRAFARSREHGEFWRIEVVES